MEPPYFTIDELAERLRTSRPTITRAIASGALRATRGDGIWVISLADAHRYLRGLVVAPRHIRPAGLDVTAPLPRLHSFAEAAHRLGRSRRSLEDGARANPPRFAHVRHGRKRWLTDPQIKLLAGDVALSRAA